MAGFWRACRLVDLHPGGEATAAGGRFAPLGNGREEEAMHRRRGFLKILLGGAAALLAWPAAPARAGKVAVGLDKLEKLQEVGGSLTVRIKERDVLLIRDTAETVRAFNPVCTHQQCLVAYKPSAGKIECPCHGSQYTLDGKVLNGPAPAALQVYPATLLEGRVILTLED
jgi:nitrite reductase/ring-hydroxylating ferredoxin subunit